MAANRNICGTLSLKSDSIFIQLRKKENISAMQTRPFAICYRMAKLRPEISEVLSGSSPVNGSMDFGYQQKRPDPKAANPNAGMLIVGKHEFADRDATPSLPRIHAHLRRAGREMGGQGGQRGLFVPGKNLKKIISKNKIEKNSRGKLTPFDPPDPPDALAAAQLMGTVR
jgi:hypothetical protein